MEKRILVANGVNLDLLGRRDKSYYGAFSLKDLENYILNKLPKIRELCSCDFTVKLSFFQTNDELEFLEKLSENWDGMIINPGAWTHTSLALADRLEAVAIPYIEVHLSNIFGREKFRNTSYSAPLAKGFVCGLKQDSYISALYGLISLLTASI